MKRKKVLSWKQLPAKPPFLFGMVCWLLLDRFSAAGWVWGVVGTLVGIMFIGWVYSLFTEDQIELDHLG